jgi:hypothetical protein
MAERQAEKMDLCGAYNRRMVTAPASGSEASLVLTDPIGMDRSVVTKQMWRGQLYQNELCWLDALIGPPSSRCLSDRPMVQTVGSDARNRHPSWAGPSQETCLNSCTATTN